LALQSAGTLSFNNIDEVDGYLKVIDKVGLWVFLFVLGGVVSYIAVTGARGDIDKAASNMLIELKNSTRFDQMEIDYDENTPDEVKAMVDAANSILKMANSLLKSDALGSLTDVVDDLADGPDE
ncbi:MAG: hypothetical protein KAS32_11555, partial [Candidatus Peribacteraceae bacterium]|nr:hypothetical protein [Candidatus Peribacteraceae bacterium]